MVLASKTTAVILEEGVPPLVCHQTWRSLDIDHARQYFILRFTIAMAVELHRTEMRVLKLAELDD